MLTEVAVVRIERACTLENSQSFLAHSEFLVNTHVACPCGEVLLTECWVRETLGSHFTDGEMNVEGILLLDQGHRVGGGISGF